MLGSSRDGHSKIHCVVTTVTAVKVHSMVFCIRSSGARRGGASSSTHGETPLAIPLIFASS